MSSQTLGFRPQRGANREAALGAALLLSLAGCGSTIAPSPPQSLSPPPAGEASPTVSPTKAGLAFARAALSGWRNGEPVVSIYGGGGTPGWAELSYGQAGWSTLGDLPDGLTPVTDGQAIASVVDPSEGNAVALLDPSKGVHRTTIPAAGWASPWLGVHGLAPLAAEPGFLLVGAAAIATIDDEGNLNVRDLPTDFVAAAPTSDARTFVLAKSTDAEEPGGLSDTAPFGAYLWTIGSKTAPRLVAQQVAGISKSSIGLAWLRGSDGAWSSLTPSGNLQSGVAAQPNYSYVSPDGKAVLQLAYSRSGCVQESTDSCPVRLIDSGGSRVFNGPAAGAEFAGSEIASLLRSRPSLQLPWRLIVGPVENPETVPIP